MKDLELLESLTKKSLEEFNYARLMCKVGFKPKVKAASFRAKIEPFEIEDKEVDPEETVAFFKKLYKTDD